MPKRMLSYVREAHMGMRDWGYLLLICIAMILLTNTVRQYLKDTAPPEDYFEVRQMNIPDFYENENPKITYDREVKVKFTASWIAEIQDAYTFQSVCQSNKTSQYDPAKTLPKGGPTLSWLMYREPLPDCSPPPGRYRVNICWTIQRVDAIPVLYCKNSNVFEVFDERSRHQGAGPD